MYKNWKAICRIRDTHVMWAVALIDMDSDIGRQFVERLPEYFTEVKTVGPIPLSVLRTMADQHAVYEGLNSAHDHLVSYVNFSELGIPLFWFSDDPEYTMKSRREVVPIIPEGMRRATKVGTVCEWEGKKVVLVENLDHELWFAPAELIDVDR